MKRLLALLACLVMLFSVSAIAAAEEEERPLSFCFIDAYDGTKWGDCTLITFPNGEVMLLDMAIRNASSNVIQKLKDRGVETIDYLVLSHFHSDHQGSLREIIDAFEVKSFYSTSYAPPDARWVELYVKEHNIPAYNLLAGDSLTIGDVEINILWPLPEEAANPPQESGSLDSVTLDVNNHSMVMRFDYAGKRALFTGDLYDSGESRVLAANDPADLKADLMKIMHHGHGTSGSDAFLDAVMPSYAVSMGGVVMTMPEYLKYVQRGCWPYATWMNGDVEIMFYQDRIEENLEEPGINEFYAKLELKYPRNQSTEE